MLDPGLVRVRRGQVQVDLHREVRRQAQPRLVGQRHDLQERRDAADARRVGLDDVDRTLADQLRMLGHAGQHLAAGDRRVEERGQRGMAFGVVGIERLFDPGQVERLDQAAEALRGDAVPLLVGVDHQRHAARRPVDQ